MKKKISLLLCLHIISSCSHFSVKKNESTLSGRLYLDFSKREMMCDVCLNFPSLKSDSAIYLSSDFKVGDIKVRGKSVDYKMISLGKIKRYVISGDFSSFCMSYRLKNNVSVKNDYKGANNLTNYSFRGTEQSAWYPYVFPIDKKVTQTDFYNEGRLEFNLGVKVSDPSFVYLNGAKPQIGKNVNFKTFSSFSPMIYISKNMDVMDKGFIVGEKASVIFKNKVDEVINDVVLKYQIWSGDKSIKVPNLLIFKSSTEKKEWSFVAYPTIAITSYTVGEISRFMRESKNKKWGERFIAHEVSHYFFGERLKPTGKEFWFLLESLSEYLALKYLKEANYKEYERTVKYYQKEVFKNTDNLQILTGKFGEEFNYFNRYKLGPLMLLKLEQELGDQISNKLLKKILRSKNNKWTYENFRKEALQIGEDKSKFTEFEDLCFKKKPTKNCFTVL